MDISCGFAVIIESNSNQNKEIKRKKWVCVMISKKFGLKTFKL